MSDSLNPTVIEGLAAWKLEAVALINSYEDKVSGPELEASDLRWLQAEEVVVALDEGMTQQEVADNWKRVDGTTYSQNHVHYVKKTWATYHLSDNRPQWNEAYNSDEVRGTKNPRPDGDPTESNEWYTPVRYLAAARSVLGKIDLDPASSEEANERVKAAHFYTEEDNGLDQTWKGRVWLNPPYGGESGDFTQKLLAEYEAENVKAAMLLVNANSTDTTWFAPLWGHTLCFTDHRIDFDTPEGVDNPSSSNHGSVFVYLGANLPDFVRVFSRWGVIVRRWP